MKRYVIFLILFAAAEIALALSLTYLREVLWNAISSKNFSVFLNQIYIFTGLALAICFVSGFSGYLVSLTSIAWRKKLNDKAFILYEQQENVNIENWGQRHQSDVQEYPDLMLNLLFGTVKSIFYIIVFSCSLLISFHAWYLLILVMYTIIGTLVTSWVAKPLIKLNYEQQRCEASYRQDLSINNFSDCIRIMLGLAKKQKHLTYWQQFYGQVGVVVPLIMIAPVYFVSPGMTLGILMRYNSLASTILDNLNYGVTSFAQINRLISCRKRLLEANILTKKCKETVKAQHNRQW